ncbi:conserved hypothetical protein [Coccidioides posadasii str. Silveira]|uniref:Uncharacterized protein n=2 Tax=Coccidioides posadasii TaxID=199306 RepID=E9D0P7_COCPS|nr:conserved hypothetical protein [Coccidioides posadasii str. Silveira]KMM73528.1 hypothetical protein CPAG_09816 [Coccidioides posadasii RMSCC 3488]
MGHCLFPDAIASQLAKVELTDSFTHGPWKRLTSRSYFIPDWTRYLLDRAHHDELLWFIDGKCLLEQESCLDIAAKWRWLALARAKGRLDSTPFAGICKPASFSAGIVSGIVVAQYHYRMKGDRDHDDDDGDDDNERNNEKGKSKCLQRLAAVWLAG